MVEKYNIEELIVRFLKQEINEDEFRYLESWLKEDEGHKAYFFDLKNISDLFEQPYHRSTSDETSWQKMYARIENLHEETLPHGKSRIRDSFWLSVAKYAAVAILALGLGWGIHDFQPKVPFTVPTEKVLTWNEIQVPKGGRANSVTLSDGTKVILNAGTTFKYPNVFDEENRKVYLEGEAYFEVTASQEKPFIVKLDRQDITVLGTTFNVQAYEGESYSIVTLLKGQVALETFNDTGEVTGHALLKPNQQALSDNHDGTIALSNVDASLANAWINGAYKFKDEPLSLILKRLENYYDIRIHLDDPELGEVLYTGTFSLDQDILDVLRVIDHERRLVFKRIKKDIFITSK